LDVLLRRTKEVNKDDIEREARNRNSKVISVLREDLSEDPQMQNVVLVGTIAHKNVIPGISVEHYEKALSGLLGGELLKEKLELFRSVVKQE